MSMAIDITLSKKYSPHKVHISTDPADDHFCTVDLIKAKGGQLVASHYILTSDVEQ